MADAKRPRPDEEAEAEEGEIPTSTTAGTASWPAEAPVAAVASAPPARPTECCHEVKLPLGHASLAATDPLLTLPIPASFDALDFPFALDPFQQKAIAAV